MTESPAAATPYEVLGVAAAASQDDLRRAYRRLARETHPDLGGTPEHFRQVQLAWERVGTPEDRARYDASSTSRTTRASSGRPGDAPEQASAWAPVPPRRRPESKPRARAFGHPGGQERLRYLELLREWVGLGDEIADPYDPVLVRSAPPEIRRVLAKAIAEESTATAVVDLGIAYTIWSNVEAGREPGLDHVVLAPSGLYAINSEDWGRPIRLVRGEVESDGLAPGEQPVRALARSARAFQKETGVPFQAQLLVVPDDAQGDAVEPVSRGRRNAAFAVQRSVLPQVLRGGLQGPDAPRVDVFEIRARLQQSVRFV